MGATPEELAQRSSGMHHQLEAWWRDARRAYARQFPASAAAVPAPALPPPRPPPPLHRAAPEPPAGAAQQQQPPPGGGRRRRGGGGGDAWFEVPGDPKQLKLQATAMQVVLDAMLKVRALRPKPSPCARCPRERRDALRVESDLSW